jgi:hypothetical protein
MELLIRSMMRTRSASSSAAAKVCRTNSWWLSRAFLTSAWPWGDRGEGRAGIAGIAGIAGVGVTADQAGCLHPVQQLGQPRLGHQNGGRQLGEPEPPVGHVQVGEYVVAAMVSPLSRLIYAWTCSHRRV